MSFTDGKPFTVTAEHLKVNWSGRGRAAFRCGLCMHSLEKGDVARWVYVARQAPNIFVCEACDGPDVAERFQRRWADVIRPILEMWGEL